MEKCPSCKASVMILRNRICPSCHHQLTDDELSNLDLSLNDFENAPQSVESSGAPAFAPVQQRSTSPAGQLPINWKAWYLYFLMIVAGITILAIPDFFESLGGESATTYRVRTKLVGFILQILNNPLGGTALLLTGGGLMARQFFLRFRR